MLLHLIPKHPPSTSSHHSWCPNYKFNYNNLNCFLNTPAVRIYLSIFLNVEQSFSKYKQSRHNKTMHTMAGNIAKMRKCISILEINKGSSHIFTNIETIKAHIYTHSPIICTITESNSKIDDDLNAVFPDYDILKKTEDSHPMDRVIVLVKNDSIVFERIHNLET